MYKHFFKRFFDCLISLTVLVVLLPVLIIVAIINAIAVSGNPFFLQARPGKNSRVFKVIKFKSMNDEKDTSGKLLPDTERLTKFGHLLRITSIDELPQLYNVLKGNMSLIGPRPLFVQYLPFYTQRESKRHLVRPGITGLAQIKGRNNLDWNERLELDVKYVETLSLSNDAKIFFKTFFNVLTRKDIVVIPGEKHDALNTCREVKLKARKFKRADIQTRVDWINNPRVNNTMPFDLPATVKRTTEWFKNNIGNQTRIDLTFTDRQNNIMAMGGYTHIDLKDSKAEFYVMVNPDSQGKGIGKKATKWLLNYAFLTYDLNKIYLYTYSMNNAANRIYESYSFKLEGVLRKHAFKNGNLCDRRIYGLLREEWEKAPWRVTDIEYDF
ncbi:MAG: GNAT family N-acetyltransferase [Bacteroidetes bacterium]|nr:GNAT family N-acetyltransferase [Bacteroidota bacterium]